VILRVPSITWPCCISSVYKVWQPASSAAAIMRLSKMLYPYFSNTLRARVMVSVLTVLTMQALCRLRAWATAKALSLFNFLRHTFTFSKITCVLIVGRLSKSSLVLANFGCVSSKMYKQMLESKKISACVRFFAIKFKLTQIHVGSLPKLPSLFKAFVLLVFSNDGSPSAFFYFFCDVHTIQLYDYKQI